MTEPWGGELFPVCTIHTSGTRFLAAMHQHRTEKCECFVAIEPEGLNETDDLVDYDQFPDTHEGQLAELAARAAEIDLLKSQLPSDYPSWGEQ